MKSSGWKKFKAIRAKAKQGATTDGTVLLKAAKMLKLRLVRLMLDGGVDVNWQNVEGCNALMCVITSHTTTADDPQAANKSTMVDYLLKVGADPNARDRSGKTALIHACQQNSDADIVQLLLASGADPSTLDSSARTALDYAQAQQNSDVITLLRRGCHVGSDDDVAAAHLDCGACVGEREVSDASVRPLTRSAPTSRSLTLKNADVYESVQRDSLKIAAQQQQRQRVSRHALLRQNTVAFTGSDEFRQLWEQELRCPYTTSSSTAVSKLSAIRADDSLIKPQSDARSEQVDVMRDGPLRRNVPGPPRTNNSFDAKPAATSMPPKRTPIDKTKAGNDVTEAAEKSRDKSGAQEALPSSKTQDLSSSNQTPRGANWQQDHAATKPVVDDNSAALTSAARVTADSNMHDSRVLNTPTVVGLVTDIGGEVSTSVTDAARNDCQQETSKRPRDVTSDAVKSGARARLLTSASTTQGDVGQTHPHAKFLQVRSKTFHASRLRSEFIEKI